MFYYGFLSHRVLQLGLYTFGVLMVISGVFQTGCEHASPPNITQGPATNSPTTAGSIKSLVSENQNYRGYFYVMPTDQRADFSGVMSSIKFGDSTDSVIRKLGNPENDAAGDAKNLVGRQHRSRFIRYVIAKYKKDLVTTGKDQYVSFWFDANGRLELISSTYPGVTSREIPDAMDNSTRADRWKFWK